MSRSTQDKEFWELPDRQLKKPPQDAKPLKQVILPMTWNVKIPQDNPEKQAESPAEKTRPSAPKTARSTQQKRQGAPTQRKRTSSGAARPARTAAPADRASVRSAHGQADREKIKKPKAAYSKKPMRMPSGSWFFAGAFVVILLLSGVITAIIEAPGKIAEAQSLSASIAAAESAALQQQLANQLVVGEQVGPVFQSDWSMRAVESQWVRLPENGRVDMSYFNDALFVGDSLTQGFTTYTSNGFENAKFAAYIGAGPKTFIDGTVVKETGETVRPLDEVIAANAKKVYILLGTNSLETMSDEGFLEYYRQMVALFKQNLAADTVFYLQSIPPASAEKIAENEKFALERVRNLNEQIAKIAYDNGVYFLDLYAALADETGALSPAYNAGDGLHLNAQGYEAWREYLITHTAYRPGVLYLPGSPYYTVQPSA